MQLHNTVKWQWLSDGSTLTEQDAIRVPGVEGKLHPALAAVRRNFVELKDGTRLHFFEPMMTPVKIEEPKKAEENAALGPAVVPDDPQSTYLPPDKDGVARLRHPGKLGEPVYFEFPP